MTSDLNLILGFRGCEKPAVVVFVQDNDESSDFQELVTRGRDLVVVVTVNSEKESQIHRKPSFLEMMEEALRRGLVTKDDFQSGPPHHTPEESESRRSRMRVRDMTRADSQTQPDLRLA